MMRPERKADLQRKLAMAPIPKPPAGLAERIKSDIPKELQFDANRERQRLQSSVAFNLRIAASIVFLVSSLYLVLHLMSRSKNEAALTAQAPVPALAAAKIVESTGDFQPPQPGSAKAQKPEVPLPIVPPSSVAIASARMRSAKDRHEEATGITVGSPTVVATMESTDSTSSMKPQPPAETPVAQAPLLKSSEPQESKQLAANAAPGRSDEWRVQDGVAAGVVEGVPGGVAPEAAKAAAPQAAEPKLADAASKPLRSKSAPPPAASKPSSALLREAVAADLTLGSQTTLFGIATDSRAFDRFESAIDRDAATRNVSTTAVVQHFAVPASRPKRDLRVELESATSPLDETKRLVRISIDAPAANVQPGASLPPAASEATLDVTFDSDGVLSHRALTGEITPGQPLLLKGSSVTALYEIELKPGIGRHHSIAAVRLRYRSAADGDEKTVERTIRRSDIETWEAASTRMKGAALGAAWSEALRSNAPADAIIAKAREAKLDELVRLAERAQTRR